VEAAVEEARAAAQQELAETVAKMEGQLDEMVAGAVASERGKLDLEIADAVHKAVSVASAKEEQLLSRIEEEKEMRLQAEEQADSGSGTWMREQLQALQAAHAEQLMELKEHAAIEKADAVADLTTALALERDKGAMMQKSLTSLQSRRSGQTLVLKKTQAMLGKMRAELQWLTEERQR
jgi:hypothetical protein